MKKYLLALFLGMGLTSAMAQDYTVQVGAFEDLNLARQQAQRARSLNVPVKIFGLKTQNGIRLYRVRTAPVSPEQARVMAERLRRHRVEVILVPRR